MVQVAVVRTKKSGACPALVFRHIVLLLVCFVSHGFASVLHPKFLIPFEVKQAKLGFQFRYFASKSFASFRFSFSSKRNLGTPYAHLTTTKLGTPSLHQLLNKLLAVKNAILAVFGSY